MTSSFTWVDFADKDRQKMMEIIRMGRDRDTRDELGLGSVRDAIANTLFPGTSTIQTRVKYMLFVPWIYLLHEKKKTSHQEIREKARADEISLIRVLKKTEDQEGIIGAMAGSKLQRLPSSIYWAGLQRWGIRLFPGSQDQYHQSLRDYYPALKKLRLGDDEEPVTMVQPNWHPGLPKVPDNFPREAAFSLNQEQAEYLKDRISLECPDSLLAYLVNNTDKAECRFVWEHPQLAEFPATYREQIQHAKNFSLIMHGAALLYNLMLAEICGNDNHAIGYRRSLEKWEGRIAGRLAEYGAWDRDRFWAFAEEQGGTIPGPTQRFVESWIECILQSPGVDSADSAELRRMIHRREREVKGNRARLINRRSQDMWSGASGTGQLSFRWRIVNSMVNDIRQGLME